MIAEDKWLPFERELTKLLNKYDIDADCHVPDYLLAFYITDFLNNYCLLQEEIERLKKMQEDKKIQTAIASARALGIIKENK